MRHAGAILTCLFLLLVLTALPVAAEEYPPGIMYSTLLNGVTILSKDGRMQLDNIQAVFLPEPTNSDYYPYNPDSGATVWTILRTPDGEELYRFDWYASVLKKPYWLLDSYKLTDLRRGSAESGGYFQLAPGDYVLDFHLDGGRFYTFPFSVSTVPPADPFGGDDFWFLDGPWDDWGYFYYYDANPEQSIQFKVWLRNKAHEMNRDVKPMLKVYRGSELVCTSREHTTYGLSPSWNRYELDLIYPMEGTSGGAYFKAKNLLEHDGSYVMKLYLSDELSGEWAFSVAGGALEYTGRTVRGTDPLTFVEGGRDAWWYKKR